MNIKDFLIENYIWLLVIILITIVTIIGFLADKKRVGKKDKNKEKLEPKNINNQPVNNQPPIQYRQPEQVPNQVNNSMGMNFNNMNTTVRPLNQMNTGITEPQPIMYTQPKDLQPMNNPIETMNSPQPVENIAPNIVQEPIYQPLSEQKPVIAPQQVPNFSDIQVPINTEINQVQPMAVNSIQPENNAINVIPTTPSIMMPQYENMMKEQQFNPTPLYNQQSQIPVIENNNYGITPNFIPNNTTVPQPVNPISEPQSIIPQPIMQNNFNQSGTMPQHIVQPQPVEQPNTNMGQPTQNIVPQPINFVYGPQNNNQNM